MRVSPSLALVAVCSAALLGEQKPLPFTEASLRLEKQSFLVGEPIIAILRVRYTGQGSPMPLSLSDPYGFCGGYKVTVNPKGPEPDVPSGPACAPWFSLQDIHCLIGALPYNSEKQAEQRILLNRFHDFTHPGVYTVEVSKHLSFLSSWGKEKQPIGHISETFTISILPPHSIEDLNPSFATYLSGLNSTDYWWRNDAASILSFLALPAHEDALLGMLRQPDLIDSAIRGLGRLNTSRGRAALFDFLRRSATFEHDQQLAADTLAESGDIRYGSKLLALLAQFEAAEAQVSILSAAARLAPDFVRPVLESFLSSENASRRVAATVALEATGQPWAIPDLIPMLKDESFLVRAGAATSLADLTRESPQPGSFYSTDPGDTANFWEAWLANHPDKPIHLVRDCPEAMKQNQF